MYSNKSHTVTWAHRAHGPKIKKINWGLSYINNYTFGNIDRNLGVYNQYDLNTNSNDILSSDYQYLYRNLNFFGEFGRSRNGGTAQLHGVLIGLDKTLNIVYNANITKNENRIRYT